MTDREIVATLNACINWDQFKAKLSSCDIERFKCIMKHNRLGAVCFFLTDGFGLKVYNDPLNEESPNGDDECVPSSESIVPNKFNCTLEGRWMRCPATLLTKPEDLKLWIVMSKDARQYVRIGSSGRGSWQGIRSNATLFTKSDAEKMAEANEGIVVLKDRRSDLKAIKNVLVLDEDDDETEEEDIPEDDEDDEDEG